MTLTQFFAISLGGFSVGYTAMNLILGKASVFDFILAAFWIWFFFAVIFGIVEFR